MKNFKLCLKKDSAALSKALDSFQNDALRNIASQMVNGDQAAGLLAWLKAHGNVTWGKAGA